MLMMQGPKDVLTLMSVISVYEWYIKVKCDVKIIGCNMMKESSVANVMWKSSAAKLKLIDKDLKLIKVNKKTD